MPDKALKDKERLEKQANEKLCQVLDAAAAGSQTQHSLWTICGNSICATDQRAPTLAANTIHGNPWVGDSSAFLLDDLHAASFVPTIAQKSINRTGSFILGDLAIGRRVMDFASFGFPTKSARGLEFLAKNSVCRGVRSIILLNFGLITLQLIGRMECL